MTKMTKKEKLRKGYGYLAMMIFAYAFVIVNAMQLMSFPLDGIASIPYSNVILGAGKTVVVSTLVGGAIAIIIGITLIVKLHRSDEKC